MDPLKRYTYRVTVNGNNPREMRNKAIDMALKFYGQECTAEVVDFDARPTGQFLPDGEIHRATVRVVLTAEDFTPPKNAPRNIRYAYAVAAVLADPGGFSTAEFRSLTIEHLAAQFLEPVAYFEFIVDSPSRANWKLVSDRQNPGFVRLGCWKPEMTQVDKDRADAVNDALTALAADFR